MCRRNEVFNTIKTDDARSEAYIMFSTIRGIRYVPYEAEHYFQFVFN